MWLLVGTVGAENCLICQLTAGCLMLEFLEDVFGVSIGPGGIDQVKC